MSGLVALLDEADYLVDLVGNHVPVLVLVRSFSPYLLVNLVRVVIAVDIKPTYWPHCRIFATAADVA